MVITAINFKDKKQLILVVNDQSWKIHASSIIQIEQVNICVFCVRLWLRVCVCKQHTYSSNSN